MHTDKNAVHEGVKFVKDSRGNSHFILCVQGDEETYTDTIKALLNMIGAVDETCLADGDIQFVCNMLNCILPSCRQIKNIEHA